MARPVDGMIAAYREGGAVGAEGYWKSWVDEQGGKIVTTEEFQSVTARGPSDAPGRIETCASRQVAPILGTAARARFEGYGTVVAGDVLAREEVETPSVESGEHPGCRSWPTDPDPRQPPSGASFVAPARGCG